jgi:hypothetical protein
MKVGCQDESKNKRLGRDMYLRKVTMKYYRFIVFIRHDFAETWGFRLYIGIDSHLALLTFFANGEYKLD